MNALADADRCHPGIVDQRAVHLPRFELTAQVGPVVVGLAEQTSVGEATQAST